MDGVQTVEHIRQYDKRAIVIFISNFVQYITSALRHNVFQYLLKPVKQDLFDYEFNRALNFYSLCTPVLVPHTDRVIILRSAKLST
jgi:two-component SAPR family response regulator